VRLRWLGIGALAVGVVIMCVPYRYTVPFRDGAASFRATARCVALRDAFKTTPDGGWFGYAPHARSFDLASSFCGPTARRRVALGVLPMVAGTGILLWARRGSRSNGHHW
jgi:hypothetical protein